MYKLAKWLYELGAKNEYRRIKADMLLFLGQEPTRYEDTKAGLREDDTHYNKRIDGWFAAKEILENYFYSREDNNGDAL